MASRHEFSHDARTHLNKLLSIFGIKKNMLGRDPVSNSILATPCLALIYPRAGTVFCIEAICFDLTAAAHRSCQGTDKVLEPLVFETYKI